MGIIRRINSVDYDKSRPRQITEIIYDGWEARADHGAQDLAGRQWKQASCGKLTGVSQKNPPGPLNHAFCRIHIIALLPELIAASRGIETKVINRFLL